MILITPDERVSHLTDLLRSLGRSLRKLREQAENLRDQIEAGEDADLAGGGKQLAQIDGLIRVCQKVETNLVEHTNRKAGIAQGGYALDLAEARAEIGGRLDRLRRSQGEGHVPE